ncbi:hypothetical protein GH758_00010 [Listeria monocytogenes]|uniref:hypothetical protein n=1 Tax=Listeria monocytogenes TaxID=1639 RepID=UPI001299FF19|nr:hypothetical protein [Listeria monocytogenes]QGF44197.1 hypothetical protein GH758_00010 [Listeria monocytogenes]
MNKLVLSTLSVAAMGMVFFSGGTAYAADKEGNTVVEYSVEGDYTLVVPEKVNLSNDNATEMSVKTINRNLEPGKEVEVTLSSGLSADGEIELQRVGAISDVITSSFKSNNSVVPMANPVIGSFSGYAMEETEVSKIQIGNPQGDKNGAYQTTLTFTAAFK